MRFFCRFFSFTFLLLGTCLAGSVSYAQKTPVPFKRVLTEESLRLAPLRFQTKVPVSRYAQLHWIKNPPLSSLSARVLAESISIRKNYLPKAKQNVFPGKQTVDAVIFDLDGTLLDSLSAWDNSAVNFLRTQGIEAPPGFNEEVAKMSLLDGAKLAKKQFNLPQSPEEILQLTLEPIRQHYYRDILPKEGVSTLLRFLRAQGIKLCIATASDKKLALAALQRTGLLDCFDFIITCDEVGTGKRNPAVYEAALKKLGTSKSRTLVVEDALYALRTARQAGFITAAIADEHAAKDQLLLQHTADYYLDSFAKCRIGN